MLNVLSVAYRLAAPRRGAVGGAEQVLATLDRALCRAGHRSVVLAGEGARVEGELWAVPIGTGPLTDARRARIAALFSERLAALVRERAFDVVHFHGVDVGDYPLGAEWLMAVPKLVTLHLPFECYPPELFAARGELCFNAVSDWQRRQIEARVAVRATIPNGIDLDEWRPLPSPRGDYVLCLGRICPEKGFDLALRAARAAGVRLILAGQTYAYAEHERHFEQDIRPLLDADRRFIGSVSGEHKRRLLANASAVLVPSRVAETFSLVTLEALACGTPVIVPRAGAPRTWIEPGVTGWIADGELELAQALRQVDVLSRAECRRQAQRFDVREMARRYLDLYAELAQPLPARARA